MKNRGKKPPQQREWRKVAEADAQKRRKVARTEKHPLYGEIPLLEVVHVVEGREIRYLKWDWDYRPPMPKGAVVGDLDQQHFCPMCHKPRYFYVDQTRSCVGCGQEFVFGAAEQKFWYETLKFHFDSVPIRCMPCRKRMRSARALNDAVSRAKARWLADNTSPAGALGVAEALVRLHELTGNGDLDEAVGLARRAANMASSARGQLAESLFWQGKAEVLRGGDPARAAALLTEALPGLPSNRRANSLREEAQWHLAELDRGVAAPSRFSSADID